MNKTHKVVMLPTTEVSQLCYNEHVGLLFTDSMVSKVKEYINQHLYIISDEEIKEGDWYYRLTTKGIAQAVGIKDKFYSHKSYKKIIATTDKSLCTTKQNRNLGQAVIKPIGIPESFVQVYAMRPIDEVQLEYTHNGVNFNEFNKLKLRDDNTCIIHKVKEESYTRMDLIYCVSEIAAQLGHAGTSDKMKIWNDATVKWMDENK